MHGLPAPSMRRTISVAGGTRETTLLGASYPRDIACDPPAAGRFAALVIGFAMWLLVGAFVPGWPLNTTGFGAMCCSPLYHLVVQTTTAVERCEKNFLPRASPPLCGGQDNRKGSRMPVTNVTGRAKKGRSRLFQPKNNSGRVQPLDLLFDDTRRCATSTERRKMAGKDRSRPATAAPAHIPAAVNRTDGTKAVAESGRLYATARVCRTAWLHGGAICRSGTAARADQLYSP